MKRVGPVPCRHSSTMLVGTVVKAEDRERAVMRAGLAIWSRSKAD